MSAVDHHRNHRRLFREVSNETIKVINHYIGIRTQHNIEDSRGLQSWGIFWGRVALDVVYIFRLIHNIFSRVSSTNWCNGKSPQTLESFKVTATSFPSLSGSAKGIFVAGRENTALSFCIFQSNTIRFQKNLGCRQLQYNAILPCLLSSDSERIRTHYLFGNVQNMDLGIDLILRWRWRLGT